MAKQAMDTFTADLADGTQQLVVKGQVLPDGHVAVRHAPGLFVEFDMGEEPAKPARGRRAAG